MNELYKLSSHSNVHTYEYYGKTLVLYDDHRYLLNILFEATKQQLFEGKIPNVIYFDYHDDALETRIRVESLFKKHGINSISEMQQRDFWAIVEFDLNHSDDNWVTTGMELGLIQDVVCVGCEEYHNISSWVNHVYKSSRNTLHKGFYIGHLNHEIESRGSLGDSMTTNHPEYTDIRNIFNYQNGQFHDDPFVPYVLDFDLDCFTTICRDNTYAWPEKVFQNEYFAPDKHSTNSFINKLIKKASVITICREPECCGGIGESNKILGYLDRYFFDGTLKTEPLM